jgi:hypothetical protein
VVCSVGEPEAGRTADAAALAGALAAGIRRSFTEPAEPAAD